MPTASSLSQSMKISKHLELSTSPSVRFTCPCGLAISSAASLCGRLVSAGLG
jgi:hypothetical protein